MTFASIVLDESTKKFQKCSHGKVAHSIFIQNCKPVSPVFYTEVTVMIQYYGKYISRYTHIFI